MTELIRPVKIVQNYKSIPIYLILGPIRAQICPVSTILVGQSLMRLFHEGQRMEFMELLAFMAFI